MAERGLKPDVRRLNISQIGVIPPFPGNREVIPKPARDLIQTIKDYMTTPLPTKDLPKAENPTDFEGTITGLPELPNKSFVYWRSWVGMGRYNLEDDRGNKIRNPWFLATLRVTFERNEGEILTGEEIEQALKFFGKYRDAINYAIVESLDKLQAGN